MKKPLAAAFVAAAALTLAACNGASTDDDPDTTAPDTEEVTDAGNETDGGNETDENDGASDETYSVRVASLPIAESGALWAAIEEGIFADHGIEVEVVPAQGGALAIPALLAEDIQFAIGQPFGPFRADQQDLGVTIIGNYADSIATGQDVNGVVSAAESGIERPADLTNKRVAVNSLGAAGDATIMQAVLDDGGDPSTIEFVEVGFPDAPAQLEQGNIDAAWVPDPFMSMVVGGGGNLVMHPYQETVPGLTVLTTITSQHYMDYEPDMVAAFSAAMDEALTWADANEEAVRAAIATNLEIPEEAAAGITLPTFTFEIKVADLEALANIAVNFEMLDSSPNFERLVQQQ